MLDHVWVFKKGQLQDRAVSPDPAPVPGSSCLTARVAGPWKWQLSHSVPVRTFGPAWHGEKLVLEVGTCTQAGRPGSQALAWPSPPEGSECDNFGPMGDVQGAWLSQERSTSLWKQQ